MKNVNFLVQTPPGHLSLPEASQRHPRCLNRITEWALVLGSSPRLPTIYHIQCAARITRHRATSLRVTTLHTCFHVFLQKLATNKLQLCWFMVPSVVKKERLGYCTPERCDFYAQSPVRRKSAFTFLLQCLRIICFFTTTSTQAAKRVCVPKASHLSASCSFWYHAL